MRTTRRQRTTRSGTLAADAWRRLNDLLGLNVFTKARILEGFINIQTNGATLGIFPDSAPDTADAGFAISAGAAIGLGPAKDSDAAWALEDIWVRNSTAGSNATVVFTGVLEVG